MVGDVDQETEERCREDGAGLERSMREELSVLEYDIFSVRESIALQERFRDQATWGVLCVV